MPPSPQDDRLTGRTILVAEDAYFIADDIASALKGAGAVVVGPASDTRTGLLLLASERVDAAVLDINLNGEPVYPLADALVARGVPFVFATGYGAAFIPAAYRSVTVWEKPFDPKALVRFLPEVFGET